MTPRSATGVGQDQRGGSVAIVTLGCARNEVDSEELAHRLQADGWHLVDDPDDADAVLVNTCGFVEAAKKDSIDTVLDLASTSDAGSDAGRAPVIAVGCLAERYGEQLAQALPEATAVLGFDDYPAISERVRAVLAGEVLTAHVPSDRRRMLPITPVDRPAAEGYVPGHRRMASGISSGISSGIASWSDDGEQGGEEGSVGWQPPVLRRRLAGGPIAPLKLASGCDRRCTFCAIPSFRGSFISRPPQEILAEAAWLAGDGARELVLVSENSTSYGKDLGDLRLLESLLPGLAAIDGIERIRVAYLQPAEVRPSLLDAMIEVPEVAGYFDLSFQHASGSVLRRMRRFGDAESFLALIEQIRQRDPQAGIRSNVIVGFPGETEADLAELAAFLQAARLDAIGVFGYSDEEGTAAALLDGKLEPAQIADRVGEILAIAEEVMCQRAEDRIGQPGLLLVEDCPDGHGGEVEGRLAHQGPEDGSTLVWLRASARIGDLVPCTVTASEGVDLRAEG